MEKNLETLKSKIVYVDTNLKKTQISGVSESELDECLKTIVEANPETKFITIQYSKRDHRLYFYTDNIILTNCWVKESVKMTKEIRTVPEILEEIKRVFLIDENESNSCISIYDADYITPLYEVLKALREKENSYAAMKKSYEDKIESEYQSRYHNNGHCFTSGFDHDTHKLKMAFSTYSFGDYHYVELYKKDGDLKAERIDGYVNTEEILLSAGNYISEAIDEYQEYDEFKLQRCEDIRTINSKFKVDISSYGVLLKSSGNNFSLNMKSYTDEPDYSCSSYNITSLLDKKENELLKKIYVRIDDCPEWMHGILFERREIVLKEKERQREEKRAIELKEKEKAEKREKKIEKRKKFRNIFSRNK